MPEPLLTIEFDSERTLQDQIREHLINLILGGFFPVDSPLPSSRKLSEILGVSRNTIALIYEGMVDGGYLIAEPRRGYFIAPTYHRTEQLRTKTKHKESIHSVEWSDRFIKNPNQNTNIVKPNDWSSFEYPFIYGQIQNEFFPLKEWRQCSRKTLSGNWAYHWLNDQVDMDDPMLVEQLKTHILPRRGIYAECKEILVTLGTQNSLYLLADLLLDSKKTIGMEDPGYREAFNIFSMFNAKKVLQPVDESGIIIDKNLNHCDYLYLTPSHQVPTGAELSEERRKKLLNLAREKNIVLIEDDYDSEINQATNPIPALKAMDSDNRVIYIGSLSKSVSPGIRVGYMVADEELISEIRALRRLMYRHPPTINQRQVALFLSLGHYDSYLRKIRELYRQKELRMISALQEHLPEMITSPPTPGGTSVWLEADQSVNTEHLSWIASRKSILIESGAVHFLRDNPPKNYFRLGFSAIQVHKIEPGIEALCHVIRNN